MNGGDIEARIREILKEEFTEFEISFIPWFSSEDEMVFRVSYPHGGYDYLEVGVRIIRLINPTTGKTYRAWAIPIEEGD